MGLAVSPGTRSHHLAGGVSVLLGVWAAHGLRWSEPVSAHSPHSAPEEVCSPHTHPRAFADLSLVSEETTEPSLRALVDSVEPIPAIRLPEEEALPKHHRKLSASSRSRIAHKG